MSQPLQLVLLAVGSFLLGSIPFGMLVARHYGVDIFAAGSGNPGATNVLRAVGPVQGVTVFLLDLAKGLAPTLVARLITPEQTLWFAIGLVAVLGHSFSPFAKFRGGKGVSSAFGAAIGAAPLVAFTAFGLFLITLAISRYVSLASTVAAIVTVPLCYLFPGQSKYTPILFAALGILVIWRHRANYIRLLNGTESTFKFKRSKPEEPAKGNDARGEEPEQATENDEGP